MEHDKFCFVIYEGPCTCGAVDKQYYDEGYQQGWNDCWQFLQDFLSPDHKNVTPPL